MFSIGEFSRHGRISVRMLRHYDAIGLLQPAYVDPASGYRFYQASQLSDLNRIIALKELGFTLRQVQEILAERLTAAELRGMLRVAELTGVAASFQPEDITPVIQPLYGDLWTRLASASSCTRPSRCRPSRLRSVASPCWTCPRFGRQQRSSTTDPWRTSWPPARRWPGGPTPAASALSATRVKSRLNGRRTASNG